MHELSFAESLIESIEREMAARDLTDARVITVKLSLGGLSCILPEALETAFEQLGAATALAGAELEMRRERLFARCRDCGITSEIENSFAPCPHCGSAKTIVEGHDAVTLESFELETFG